MPGPRVGPLGTATERIGSIGDTCYAKTETFCISQVCNLTEMRCLSLLGLVSEMPATLRSARPLACWPHIVVPRRRLVVRPHILWRMMHSFSRG